LCLPARRTTNTHTAGAPPFNADDPQQIFENILDQQVCVRVSCSCHFVGARGCRVLTGSAVRDSHMHTHTSRTCSYPHSRRNSATKQVEFYRDEDGQHVVSPECRDLISRLLEVCCDALVHFHTTPLARSAFRDSHSTHTHAHTHTHTHTTGRP
jgi:hypothetical protein